MPGAEASGPARGLGLTMGSSLGLVPSLPESLGIHSQLLCELEESLPQRVYNLAESAPACRLMLS